MNILYEKDLRPELLKGRRVAVFGFGAQGRAQALNLHDSGIDVMVGLRGQSASRAAAEAAGLHVMELHEAAASADVAVMLVPDPEQPELYAEELAPALHDKAMLVFAHGFNIHYGKISPRADLDVVMVAPLGIGDHVREVYERGGGVPALIAVHQDVSGEARDLALAYAAANGHGRAGIMETDFREETETDLFAEQAVLCGGITNLIEAAFETLVDAGYSPEVAYFCCLHEVKLMADMIHRHGIAGMRESISAIAEYGDY
ncbi:MAG: ketol-acid reductoisomerase, partial [Gammaproteobacteria bacterium]|nr:ketol-acid reductoisomerase [Gammaproteobacteria bacterium]